MRRVSKNLIGIIASADWHSGTRYVSGGQDKSAHVHFIDGTEGSAYLYADGLLVLYKEDKGIFRGPGILPHAKPGQTAWAKMCA